jgi:S1-C subfamily serine protease
VIEKIDGSPVADATALGTELAAHRPGDRVTLSILRPDGTSTSTTVTLGQLPGS